MITRDDVEDWIVSDSGGTLSLTEADRALLDRVVAAVSAHIGRTYTAPIDTAADWEQAHLMQCARLWTRRNTPNGIGGFGEFGAVRVTRLDPDVAELLSPFQTYAFA